MMIVFRLGDERYALFLSDVVAVHKCAKLAAVPGAPDSVAGVIQFRGEIRPVYRLHNHQAKPMAKKENSCHVILMRAAGGQFGVLVDSVEEIRTVPNEERRLQSQSPHVAWITEDLVSVLKIETLQNKEPG
jgi:purine-binding chemotaxis protein CheW